MKRLILYFLLIFALPAGLKAQYTVGPGGDFNNLGEAFFIINNTGSDVGDIELQIIGNFTEPSTATLWDSGHDGFSFYNSVTIFPVSAGLTISGNINGPLINLSGAANVIIDGRVNQTGSADLIITNTNTGSSASTIHFQESAVNNTVQYCTIKGSETGLAGGIIFFSTSTWGTGNDNNNILNNNITANASARPANAIFSLGTSGNENSGNIIADNNIYNFLNPGIASNGILLSSNTTSWTISENNFYETASFAPTSNVTFNAIQINNTSGNSFTVTGNFIGGKDVACGGTAWTKTKGLSPFYSNIFNAIYLNADASVASTIDDNTIKNFAWINSGNAIWTGIHIESGAANIGTEFGNIIGDPSAAGSITVTGGADNTSVFGISLSGTGHVSCQKNSIANILNATTPNINSSTIGLYADNTSLSNIFNRNFIHNLAVSATSPGSSLYGIKINNGAATYSNNIIGLGGNTPSVIYGIYETGTIGNNNNLIYNTVYINGAPVSGSANSYGLYSAVITNSRDFRNNIFDNSRSNNGATGSHYAIFILSAGGSLTIDYNDYYSPGTGGILGYLAGDKINLPAWKTATGQDANSQAINPNFAGAGSTSPEGYIPAVALVAVPGTSILDDFAGSTRSLTLPSMGAFEVGLCTNPTSGGTIGSNQSGCAPFDPVAFTSVLPASGYLGIPEYKWQQSIVNGTTGFTDIAGTNSITYNAGVRLVTTWYKRLARVTCSSDWTGAAESNVIQVTVTPKPTASITGILTNCVSTTLTAVTDAVSPIYVWYLDYAVISGETSSTLVATVSGNYKVKIINSLTSCSQISAVSSVTINSDPTASVSGTLTACVSTTLTAITDALSPAFVWYKDNVAIPGEIASTLVVTVSGSYKVKVTNGVTSCEQTSAPVSVTINPLPSASITGTLTACVTTTLTAVSDALSPSYVWYKNNIVIGGETSSTLIVTTSGDYKVKVRNGITSCENTSPVSTVVINPLPTASITGILTACASTTMTAVSDALSPAYVWYKNNVVIGGETASTLAVTSSGNYKVKVTNGVTSCEQTSSASTVVINPLPSASITGTLTACVTTTLTAVSDALSPSYVWYKNNIVIGGETASTLVVTSGGDYKVKVTNGVTSCEQTSSASTVIINPLPSASITGTLTACVSTTLTAVSDALSPSYVWYKNNIVIGGETASTLVVTSGGDYKVKVTNGVTSCEQTSSASTVVINPLPSASISGTLTACVTTTLTAVSDALSPSYVWYKNNVVIGGETASTLVVTSGGDYKVKVKNGVTSCEQTSAVSTVVINPLPSASISGTLTACVTTTLTAVSDALSPSYVWYKNNVVIGGETASTLVVNSGGDYKVKVTNGVTSCEKTSAVSTVTINPLPSASITGTLTACVTTTLSASTDALAPVYTWYKDNAVISGASSTLVVISSGDYKVKVTNGITLCEFTSPVSTVVINPLPSDNLTVNGTGTVCSGTSADISVLSSETGVIYQLRNSAGNADVGSPVNGTGGTIVMPTGNLTSPAIFNILATRAASTCSVQLTGTVSLTIDANSAGGSVNTSYSSITYGSPTGDMILTGYTGQVIKWQKTSGSALWTDISATSTAYSEIPGSAGNWQYRAQVKNSSCPAVYSAPIIITVLPKTLTISADNKERHYGEANPAFTLTYTGFVLNDDKNVLDVLPSVETSAGLNSSVGNYDITVSGGSDASYNFVYVKGTLSITKASQTITFETIPSGLRMTQEHTLVATSTSGLQVNFTSSDPTSGSITGNVLKILKDSPFTITATQAGDSNWNPADDVSQTIKGLPTFDNISSLFTPNNDGINDLWYIPDLISYGNIEVTVYNRYGQSVYHSAAYKNDWDGTWNGNPLPSGAYYYLMKSSTKGAIKGVVNILR